MPSRKRTVDPEAIASRAESNGYVGGQHEESDKQRDANKFDDSTIEQQDHVLDVFTVWSMKRDDCTLPFDKYRDFALRPGTPVPELHELKDFWRFYKDQSKGRIRERPTARSLRSQAKRFKGGFHRYTDSLVSDEDTEEINRWITNVLAREEDSGVKDVEIPKFNYKPQDLDRSIKALWTRGDLSSIHIRTKVQVHLLLLWFCGSGARSGGFFKAGTLYKDVHLVLERTPEGAPKLFFALDQRTVKNNKDQDNKKFGVTGREHPLLRYNAVFFLVQLAIADGALDRDYFIRIMNGTGDGPIEWNDAVQDIPICRKVKNGIVHPSEHMSLEAFSTILKQIFAKEYIYSRASIHMIRRQVGKELDNIYTEAERSQHLLQADKRVFGQSYVAFMSSCDGFAAFRREKPDHSAVEYFQGIGQFWQPGLPIKLPAALKHGMESKPELIGLDPKVRQNTLKRLEKTALDAHRAECMKKARRERLLHGNSPTLDDDPDPLNELVPEKRRMAVAMMSDVPLTPEREIEAMQDMFCLLKTPWGVFYLPGEWPLEGECGYCHTKMDRINKPYRCKHIHHCRKTDTAEKLGVLQSALTFCYFCMDFYTPDEWMEDCRKHLKQLPKRCGSVKHQHTVVRPAFCLICKQSPDLSPDVRMQYWERDTDAIRHIEKCHGWLWACVECEFTCDGRDSGYYHLHDAHGYYIPNLSKLNRSRSTVPPKASPTSTSVSEFFDLESLDGHVMGFTSLPLAPELRAGVRLLDLTLPVYNVEKTSLSPSISLLQTLDDHKSPTESSDMESPEELMSKFISFPPTPEPEFATSFATSEMEVAIPVLDLSSCGIDQTSLELSTLGLPLRSQDCNASSNFLDAWPNLGTPSSAKANTAIISTSDGSEGVPTNSSPAVSTQNANRLVKGASHVKAESSLEPSLKSRPRIKLTSQRKRAHTTYQECEAANGEVPNPDKKRTKIVLKTGRTKDCIVVCHIG